MEPIAIKRFLDTDAQIRQEYLILKRNIRLYGPEMKIIGFTSCNQEDEKSSVILNIAAAMAKERKKVSIIDIDINHFSQSSLVSDQQVRGMSNCLTATDTAADLTCKTDIENLFIVLYGSALPNASEAEGMKKLNELIQELANTDHYILVNIPPLNASDATETLKACDGIVLVVKANAVSYKSARKAKIKLELSGCPILGAVLLQDA